MLDFTKLKSELHNLGSSIFEVQVETHNELEGSFYARDSVQPSDNYPYTNNHIVAACTASTENYKKYRGC